MKLILKIVALLIKKFLYPLLTRDKTPTLLNIYNEIEGILYDVKK